MNDIRFALKQEELRRMKRKEEKTSREYEAVRKVKEGDRTDGNCYNCGIKGHLAANSKKEKNASTVRDLITLRRTAVNGRETLHQ